MVETNDFRARADRDDAFVERLDDGVQQRVFGFERGQARRELLRHAVQREREIADLSRRCETRTTIELASRDRASDVAQFDGSAS